MSEEEQEKLRQILNRIGYPTALRNDPSLGLGNAFPGVFGMCRFAGQAEAKTELGKLNEFMAVLESFAPRTREMLDSHLRTPEQWDAGVRALTVFEDGLTDFVDMATKEVQEIWTGPRNPAKDQIAKWIARVYVLGTGKMPTVGQDPLDQKPTTDYCRAVRDVFSLILADNAFYEPCRKAKKALEVDENAEFRRLCEIRSRRGKPAKSLVVRTCLQDRED